jgi:hypothetical protein
VVEKENTKQKKIGKNMRPPQRRKKVRQSDKTSLENHDSQPDGSINRISLSRLQ